MNSKKLFRDLTIVNNATKALRCLDFMKMTVLIVTTIFCGFELISGYIKAKKA